MVACIPSMVIWVHLLALFQHVDAALIKNRQTREYTTKTPDSSHTVLQPPAYNRTIFVTYTHHVEGMIQGTGSRGGVVPKDESTLGIGEHVMPSPGTDSGIISGAGFVHSGSPNMNTSTLGTSSTVQPKASPSASRSDTSCLDDSSCISNAPSLGSLVRSINPTEASSSLDLPLNKSTVATGSSIPMNQFNSNLDPITTTPVLRTTSFIDEIRTTNDVGMCWEQWQTYWSLYDLRFIPIGLSTPTSTSIATTTENGAFTFTYNSPKGTSTTINIYTSTQGIDGFQITVITSTVIHTYTISSGIASTSTESFTNTQESTSLFYSPLPTNLTTPACSLPSFVPQCQAQWAKYSSLQSVSPDPLRAPPPCSQATVSPGQCVSLRSQYLATWDDGAASALNWGYGDQTIGEAETEVTLINGSSTNFGVTSWWPTHSTLFPGCTVGCLSCAITGGKVQLIYWPEGTSTLSNMNGTGQSIGPPSAIPRSITSSSEAKHNQSDVRIATAFGTTLTYPTVYISYSQVYASDSCSGVGGTYYNKIIPISDPAGLSSLWATMDGGVAGLSSASFNFTDLNSPVPASIYDRQPRCAHYSNNLTPGLLHNGPEQSPTTCPRTLPYEPILIVPPSVLKSIDPSWASCSGDIRGVYDPPYALSSYLTAAGPAVTTTTDPRTAVSAQPAPITSSPTPPSTSDADNPDSIIMSILSGQISTSADPETQTAALQTQASQSPSTNPADNLGSNIIPVIAGGRHSSAPENPSMEPTVASTSSSGAEVGGNVISALNSDGNSVAPASDTQASTILFQPTDTSTSSAASADGGGGPTPAAAEGGAPGPMAQSANSVISSSQQIPAAETVAAAPPLRTIIGGPRISSDPSHTDGVGGGSQPLQRSTQTAIDTTPISVGQQGSAAITTSSTVNSASAPQKLGSSDLSTDSTNSEEVVVGGTMTAKAGSTFQAVRGQTIATKPLNSNGAAIGGENLLPGTRTAADETLVSAGQGGTVAISGNTVMITSIAPPAVTSQSNSAIGGLGESLVIPSRPDPITTLVAMTTIGSQAITATSGQPVAIAETTLTVGAPAITIEGEAVSLGSDGLVVGVSTAVYSPVSKTGKDVVVHIGGKVYTALSSAPLVIGSTTLSVSGPAATIDGQRISVGANGVKIGSSTLAFSATAALTGGEDAVVANIGGAIYTLSSGKPLVIGSKTFLPGEVETTINGQRISVGSQGIVVGSATEPYTTIGLHPELSDAVITLGSQIYTALESSGRVVLESTTLNVGGPAVTMSGKAISAASTDLFIGPQTITYVPGSQASEGLEIEASFTISGSVHTAFEAAGHGGECVVPDAELTLSSDGPAATIDGETISAASNGIFIDGSSVPLEIATAVVSPAISGVTTGPWDGSNKTDSSGPSFPTPRPPGPSTSISGASRLVSKMQCVVVVALVNIVISCLYR